MSTIFYCEFIYEIFFFFKYFCLKFRGIFWQKLSELSLQIFLLKIPKAGNNLLEGLNWCENSGLTTITTLLDHLDDCGTDADDDDDDDDEDADADDDDDDDDVDDDDDDDDEMTKMMKTF